MNWLAIIVADCAKEGGQVGVCLDVAYLPEKLGGLRTISAKVHMNQGLEPIFDKELSHEELKVAWPALPAPTASWTKPIKERSRVTAAVARLLSIGGRFSEATS